jgi:Carboxypeptidase regulatory-like domain
MLTTRPVVPALLGVALSLAATAFGETVTAPSPALHPTTELVGYVSDEVGKPLVGATVSVFGTSLARGAVTAVTDDEGQFRVASVPPGMYRLRAYLSGFMPSAFAKIVIEEGVERVGSILMSLSKLDSAESYFDNPGEGRTLAELRWIVQHQEKNILKDVEGAVRPVSVAELQKWEEGPRFDAPFALSGEVGVRAATYEQGLDEFPGAGAGLDARLAYARLFIPTSTDAHWLVSAQVLESALSSWAGRAEYTSGDLGGHRLSTGVTYGNFLYSGVDEFRPPEAALVRSLPGRRSAEWFGSIYGADSFLVGAASVQAGMAFQYYDYLNQSIYGAPRLAVTYPLGSGEKTVLRGVVDYRILAPGGEDVGLLSRVAYSDVYGPSQAQSDLRAERTSRVGMGVEQQVSSHARLALRVFQENAADQLVKAFVENSPTGGPGNFVLSNVGDFQTRGIGVSFSQTLGPLEGSVGYTFGLARALGLPAFTESSPTADEFEIHDLTTTLGTSIDRTQTRLQAAYRVTRHPGFTARTQGFSSEPEIDGRFSIQVFQLLPFVDWNGTQWELIVAVRNLFYDDIENTSILDEMAVVDAPRRILGGVTVRF